MVEETREKKVKENKKKNNRDCKFSSYAWLTFIRSHTYTIVHLRKKKEKERDK